jgi:hypothetical protein
MSDFGAFFNTRENFSFTSTTGKEKFLSSWKIPYLLTYLNIFCCFTPLSGSAVQLEPVYGVSCYEVHGVSCCEVTQKCIFFLQRKLK